MWRCVCVSRTERNHCAKNLALQSRIIMVLADLLLNKIIIIINKAGHYHYTLHGISKREWVSSSNRSSLPVHLYSITPRYRFDDVTLKHVADPIDLQFWSGGRSSGQWSTVECNGSLQRSLACSHKLRYLAGWACALTSHWFVLGRGVYLKWIQG